MISKEQMTPEGVLAYVKGNVREGFHLNPNEKVVNGIVKGLIRCEGECPCCNDGEDKMCPCSNYRLHDHCCCHLYLPNEKEE